MELNRLINETISRMIVKLNLKHHFGTDEASLALFSNDLTKSSLICFIDRMILTFVRDLNLSGIFHYYNGLNLADFVDVFVEKTRRLVYTYFSQPSTATRWRAGISCLTSFA
jgi:hypothetical protein